jgi:hypothetical protein
MSRDTTVRATHRRLIELGYVPTSWTNPTRVSAWHPYGDPATIYEIGDHDAAILCYPTKDNRAYLTTEGDDGSGHRVIDLTVTAYLASDKRQLAACVAVLERYGLTGGPNYTDSFGNRHYVLQWHGECPIYDQHRTRLCFDSDDSCIALTQAIRPQYEWRQNRIGGHHKVPVEPISSVAIPVNCDWKQGHILDTPHRKLPELLQADAQRFIEECELARWGARPLAKDAGA